MEVFDFKPRVEPFGASMWIVNCRMTEEQTCQVYKKLLTMAQNLDESQLRESIAEVVAACPRETYEIRECPSPAHMGAER
jgi:hypothetical protein